MWNGIRGQPKFQSHAGSIEATWSDTCGGKTSSFQSHAGSIEALPPYAWVGSGGFGFNPTLVRLRPTLERVWNATAFLFQSHAGSIEAFKSELIRYFKYLVSIPRWFD